MIKYLNSFFFSYYEIFFLQLNSTNNLRLKIQTLWAFWVTFQGLLWYETCSVVESCAESKFLLINMNSLKMSAWFVQSYFPFNILTFSLKESVN